MRKTVKNLCAAFCVAYTAAFLLSATFGCKTRHLEPGGVYAPTNAAGQTVYSDLGLALTDASYKFAYETVLGVLKFERDNRGQIMTLSPQVGLQVKHALDGVRTKVWNIDLDWALARQAYKANPTPAGLSAIQTALAEIERLVPVVQSQIAPVYQTLTNPPQ